MAQPLIHWQIRLFSGSLFLFIWIISRISGFYKTHLIMCFRSF